MKYYIGPWRWDAAEEAYCAPSGIAGAIDLGPVSQMSVRSPSRRGCLCWTTGASLPAEYDHLGAGDLREIRRSAALVTRLAGNLGGYRPPGDTLCDMISAALMDGADPDGLDAPLPIEPGMDGWMDLHLVGHGRVRGDRFEWGRTAHTAKLKRSLRRQFAEYMDAAGEGRFKDANHPRKILGFWLEKFRLKGADDWKEFIPPAMLAHIEGPLPHETTITDNFDRADAASALGTSSEGWSWANVLNTWRIASNMARPNLNPSTVRANSDLSSADHYAQADFTYSGDHRGGCCVRFAAAADTWYQGWARNNSATTYRLRKMVSGSATNLTDVSTTATSSGTLKTEINGSSLTLYRNGSAVAGPTTDTSITGNVRTGMNGAPVSTDGADNFQAADLAASGILYTQLERNWTRGITRGVYTRF